MNTTISPQLPQIKNKCIVYSQLPDAGLGNMLFVWARGLVYSKIHNLEFYHSPWKKIRFRRLIKTGKFERFYSFFIRGNQIQSINYFLLRITRRNLVLEPVFNAPPPVKSIVIFNRIPPWNDYFCDIKEFREYIMVELMKIIDNRSASYLDNASAPLISAHIRLGDYKKLLSGQDFKTTGGVRTPLKYFTDIISSLREIAGRNLPVTVFTDGNKAEIDEVFEMGNIRLANSPNEITDLLLMSRSKVILTSAGSTFGYWAGFLSDAMLIMHPDHIHSNLRPDEINASFYEGPFDATHPKIIEIARNLQ